MIQDPKTSAASRLAEQSKTSCDRENTDRATPQFEDDSGNENKRKNVPQKRRKRAQTTPKSGKGPNTKADRGSGSRAGGSRDRQDDGEAVTLFEVITMGRSAIKAVIDDWIEAYEKERDPSILDLISFFIQCCGCKGLATAELCTSKDGSNIKSKMVEQLDEVSGLQVKRFLAFPWILTVTWPLDGDAEYPLVQPGPCGRWFHSELCDFMSVLVAQFQHSVLFDSYLMNAVLSLLTALSDSCVRAFRHTCTLAAVKLLSSLVRVALSLSVGIENSQKLCAVQKSKTARQKNSPQMKGIQKKITQLEEKRSEVESMMNVIFKGVFLKRYRDVLPEIRSICMEELGAWMKDYHTVFLNDGYLKYMGWMMHDKNSDVRIKCVLGLQELYGDPALFPKLNLFTSRFKERMISLTLDKDSEVAVQSMKLLVLMSNKSGDVLLPSEYRQLFQFVYSSQRPLAAAAGELMFLRLLNTSSDTQDGTSAEEAHKQQIYVKLKALLDFYQESKLHQHVPYLVDSLWDCSSALLKDWPTITSILLQEPPSYPGLKDAEETVLVEILVASVRQASEGPGLVGRSGAKTAVSVKEKRTQVDDCTKLTEHFLEALPKLLKKFLQREDVVALLLKIPQFFLADFLLPEKDQLLSDVLSAMGAVLDLHCGADVLEAAARSYLSLCGDQTSWFSTAQTARDAMVQNWMNRLRSLLEDAVKEGTFTADVDKTEEVVSTIKRVRAFHNCHDLSKWNLFELVFPLMSVDQTGLPPQVLLEVLKCLCYSMLWSLNTSSETLTSKEKALAQRLQLRQFCESSQRCLSHGEDAVRQQAFLGICDVLTAHSYQTNIWDPTCYGPLLYTPSPKLQRALLTFLCSHIFVTPESDSQNTDTEDSEVEKLEDLHKRRNLLAAFCKLVVHGILEMSLAAEVFMCYVKFYNDFGDIIKETLCRTRQSDKTESTRTLILSLQMLFMRLKHEQESGGRLHPGVQTFTSIKELARRFAMTFGDLMKFRECVVMIHRSGIDFVFQGFTQTPDAQTPVNLSYLTILSEFSSKLLKPDKKTMLGYLQKHTAEHITDLREECWQPLGHYRTSLLAAAEGEDALSHASSDRRLQPRSSCTKSKLEGKKSTCPTSPAADISKTPSKAQKLRFSPSTPVADMDPSFVSVAPVRRLNFDTPELSAESEAQDETVDVEL
ncbi:cohesin subunit SA-2 [Periophthalmus magnuspinnatus]|uniref:cohesin subunit SA-2 n=1 Tax=Periophthalmus magnuspinnatus TaxID=409849 RepID=UPI0024365EDA|nr:cohesin subunit SA-2 [Periophthalmus magnuspinnatus]